ncbi:NAD(P)H-binding protein [Patescibacteria group bacterium]|nr:NAD(P)H-binding protein [Patescibacteria group bacterium]MBU4580009.1 NAD(P)H-binding protein [Patescibacteria group bacterium]
MILIAGATGYIGRRVLKVLSEKDFSVRCLVRKPTIQKLDVLGIAKDANKNISYVTGDALNYNSLLAATDGIDVVYYFIHHMDSGKPEEGDKFDKLDRLAAENMARACRENKVRRIIYLGRICDPKEKLSLHLRSRKEVEDIIRASGIDYTIFRSSFIIGRGAAAFEILDSMVKKIPIIPIIDSDAAKVQPIFYKDAVKYLVDCLDKKETINKSFDIGGKDTLSYEKIIKRYAKELKIKRHYFRISTIPHWILAKVLSAISPVNANMVYWLTESLSNNMAAKLGDGEELKKIFGFEPLGFRESIVKILNENPS